MTGELDLATAPDLQAQLDRVAGQHPDHGIIIDLTAVSFMDCAGMRPILQCRARLAERLYLRGVQPRVARLFDLAGVPGILQILDDDQHHGPAAAPLRAVPRRIRWLSRGGPRVLGRVLDDAAGGRR